MSCPALSWHHFRFKKINQEEALERCENVIVFSTTCWRNYVADWHIDRDRLYLDRITGIYRPSHCSQIGSRKSCAFHVGRC